MPPRSVLLQRITTGGRQDANVRQKSQAGQNVCTTPAVMSFFRSTLLPAAIVLIFGLALFAVSARIWLPGDMAAPAPIS